MSYERNQIISLLYRIFQAEEYRWSLEGILKIPTFKDIENSVSELEYKAENCKSFVEGGRIRVEYNKESKCFNYYLYLGASNG
jgi:hypothetical protein